VLRLVAVPIERVDLDTGGLPHRVDEIFGKELYDLTPIQEYPGSGVLQVFLSRNNAVDQFELVEMRTLTFK